MQRMEKTVNREANNDDIKLKTLTLKHMHMHIISYESVLDKMAIESSAGIPDSATNN